MHQACRPSVRMTAGDTAIFMTAADPNQSLILVVDGDASAVSRLCDLLRNAGFATISAATNAQALRLARTQHPRLALVGTGLPDAAADETIRSIKADDSLSSVFVVEMSARLSSPAEQAGGLAAGADGYIVRPISDPELLERVSALLHQQQMAQALRTSEQRLRTIIDASADGILIVSRAGTIQFANPAAAMLLQQDADRLVGREFDEFMLHGNANEIELMTAHDRRVTVEVRIVPIDWDGHSAYMASLHDVTARKAVEQALRSSITDARAREAKLEQQAQLLDQAQDAIFVTDMAGTVSFWNQGAERLYGWTPRDAVGTRADTLLSDDADQFNAAMAHAFEHGEWTGELHQHSRDRKQLTVEARWTLVHDAGGAPQSILCINTDITRRLALEQQLDQAQRLETIGQLTGGVAHDFNNLLTVILGNAEMMLEQLPHGSEMRALAEMTQTAGQRGADLTHRLLAFARRQPLTPKQTNVKQLIDGMDPLIRRTLSEANEIRYAHGLDLWQATVDPSELEGALLNLCINARDAMPDGGRLTIETTNRILDEDYAGQHIDVEPGPYVAIAVSDSGTGISAENLMQVFDPFFTTKDVGKGTGLGLSMVYGFVKQSGGHIRIYSEEGQGTTVTMYLPRADGADGADEVDADAERPISDFRGTETILLVEDDDMVRHNAQSQLSELGYRVITAASGIEAMTLLNEGRDIDLLFTDIVMPGGMNGRELASKAQALRPTLRVLFTSGYSESSNVNNGRVEPSSPHLAKPYRRVDLAGTVRAILDKDFPARPQP